ncbi:hypothetical protein HHI36_020651, partial [Cryptolaemus montrouzieri]
IRSDHNSDNTIEVLETWISSVQHQYHSISTDFIENPQRYSGEVGPAHWTEERFQNIINLRETALSYARKIWADYYLTIDCDVFLTNPETLNYLISKDSIIISPLLASGDLYSNVRHGMNSDYYYYRTREYKPILYRENKTIDCDVFLTNPETLNYLISKDSIIISPMLASGDLYSNVRHGMNSDYYYYRTKEYKPILYRENKLFGEIELSKNRISL